MQKFIKKYYTLNGVLYRKSDNREMGWLCNGRYLCFDHVGKKYLVHRAIFLLHYGYLPDMVDHINRNKLDNNPENLRAADKRLNSFNTSVRKDNTSGWKGVSWSKSNSKWHSYIYDNGKRVNLGYFSDIEDAVNVREDYERSLLGKTYAEIH